MMHPYIRQVDEAHLPPQVETSNAEGHKVKSAAASVCFIGVPNTVTLPEHWRLLSCLGRLIFIHLQCCEVLPFLTIQHQRCIKILCPKDPEFYTPLALNCQEGQHLPALEVYKNQSPMFGDSLDLLHGSFGPLTLKVTKRVFSWSGAILEEDSIKIFVFRRV